MPLFNGVLVQAISRAFCCHFWLMLGSEETTKLLNVCYLVKQSNKVY